MPRRKRNNRRNNNRPNGSPRELPVSSSVYNGPIRVKRDVMADDTYTMLIMTTTPLTSSAGGALTTVFDSTANVTSASNWASLQNVFKEYRILGMELELIPVNIYTTGITQYTIITVTDRTDATALASYAGAASYASAEHHNISQRIVRTIKMAEIGEADFYPTSGATSPASNDRMYIKLYANGLGNTVTYYQTLLYFRVQFRGIY